MTLDPLALTRLLQLASPTLPVGAYSYSQGLESAVEDGIVTDAETAKSWIGDVLRFSVASFEVPLLSRMYVALVEDDQSAFARWNAMFRTGRETAELRAETLQMGQSLRALMGELHFCDPQQTEKLRGIAGLTFPAAFSFAAYHMGVERSGAAIAYVWSWLENQVMSVLKAIPLGQSDGQRMLAALGQELPEHARRALALKDDELSNFAPGLAIESCSHETQYSRLFRS